MSVSAVVSDAVRVYVADGSYLTKSIRRSKGDVVLFTPFIFSFQFPELSLKFVGFVVIVCVFVSSVFGVAEEV